MEVLKLDEGRLTILFNEAMRQRALDASFMNIAFSGDRKGADYLESLMKIHGGYTKGFYEAERKRFERFIKDGRAKRQV